MHRDLLRAFASRPRPYHPWWWPKGSGADLSSWGLDPDELVAEGLDPEDVLNSLQLGKYTTNAADVRDFDGFLGSVGVPIEPVVWVVTMRPSPNRHQHHGMRQLYQLLSDFDMLPRTRVTDVLKYRGAAPAGQAWSSADDEMREVSRSILIEEFVAHPPQSVILSGGGTQAAFKRLLRHAVRDEPDNESTKVLNTLYGLAHPVYFYAPAGWGYDEVRENWASVLRATTRMPVPAWLEQYRRRL